MRTDARRRRGRGRTHAAQLPAKSVSPDSMSPAKAAKGARSAPAASVAAATSLWASSLTDAACCAWGAKATAGAARSAMESFIFMCLCAVGVRRCAAAIGTLCRDDGKRRPCRSRAQSIWVPFWPRASSGCRGDPYGAPRPPRGARPGSLGAFLLRRALSGFYGSLGLNRAAVFSLELLMTRRKVTSRFFRRWGPQRGIKSDARSDCRRQDREPLGNAARSSIHRSAEQSAGTA